MPVIPAPAVSAMSTLQLVLRLVHEPSAEHGATPVPILHVSSYSSEHIWICLSLSKQRSQETLHADLQCTMYLQLMTA